MSTRSRLRILIDLARAWPLCLASAAIAYLTITGLLLLLAPDIAELIVNGAPTVRLILTMIMVFLLLNVLLALTCAASLFIIRRESIVEGFRRNSRMLAKGFLLLLLSSLACLTLIFFAGYSTVSSTGFQDVLRLIAVNYGAGVMAAILLALAITKMVTMLAGVRFRIGLGRFLSVTAIVFLMLTLLSAYGLTGLFTCSMLIPTVVSLVSQVNNEKVETGETGSSWFKGRSVKRIVVAITLIVLVLSTEVSFRSIWLSFAEEARFSEDRLRSIVSRAIAEGWSSDELASAIKNEPELSMLSTYDLSSITIERDDAGNVAVTIPLNAAGYAIYRRTSNKTTVYDVYSQGGSSEVAIGDKRYVLTGYRSREETYGPFETLEEALAKENEVKRNANATRIASNAALKTETREVARVETKYAIVPTARVVKYIVKAEFENYWDAENYLYCYSGMLGVAEIRMVEKQVWVESYRLEFVKETGSHYEAVMMSRDGYVTEEVREKITVYIFVKTAPVSRFHVLATVEVKKADFEKMLQTGELVKSIDEYGEEYYYYSSQGPYSARLYKTGVKQVDGDIVAWRIYRRIDTSHYETRKAYRVVVPSGYEEKKVSIADLPGYAKGFPSRSDAENSKQVVEQSLRNWVEENGMVYKSSGVESYEENTTRFETVAREVKQYYVVTTLLKPVYDVYELRPYYKAWNETYYEEEWGWVFKGYVDEKPETYDMATWVYAPEVVNWTSKTYLGIVTELEAQLLTSMDPRYVAEKHNTTTIVKETSYYDVYNATWRLLYHYYKYVVHPLHEYIANGNISSSGGWSFESLGDASGEICSSTCRSSPSSLRIVSRNGRGAWRQTFYFDAGGSNPALDFWYILRGSGAVAVKKPDGSACLFALSGSSSWNRFLRNSDDVFSQAGYYTLSFVASENSELYVDDVSVHVGGYGEWVYQGDVENKPDNVLPNEKYEAFYRIENKKLLGTFEENVANQYPTPPYIKEFNRKEKVSYVVDLYKLYYLEDGFVRYRVFHWEKYQVPIVVRKEESGARWELAESSVEMDVGGRILIEANVPESVVRAKYSDPTKYYLAPKIVEGGEALEQVCETLDESLAKKYEKEGYVVKSTRISLENPIRFSFRVLQASIERNELNMLGKQNTLKIAIANPTGDTLTYQVIIEAENEEKIEETQSQAFYSPEAVKKVVSIPIAEPSNWLLAVPPGGAPYQLAFTTWVKRTVEGEFGSYVENTAYWPGGILDCSFTVKILRNGRLVAKQRLLETFESFDIGKTIARHPFDFAQGFVTAVGIGALVTLFPQVGLPLLIAGVLTSTAIGSITALKTGDPASFFTFGPTGIVVLPIRALFDPTLDDEARCRTIGALVGALGATLAKEISNQLYIKYAPEEYQLLLRDIESQYGTITAARVAKGLIQLDYYCSDPSPMSMLKEALALSCEKGSIGDVSLLLDKVSSLSPEFLSRHADELAMNLALPDPSNKLALLLSLSQGEIDALAATYHDDLEAMMAGAVLKKLGAEGSIFLRTLTGDRLEIMVEKSVGDKLFKDIGEGQYAWFRLVGENGEVSVGLPFKEVVLNAGDWRNYYLFSLADDHLGEATRMLLGEVKVALDFAPPPSDIGFLYYGSSGWGYGNAGLGGIKTDGGTYCSQGLQQELVWSSDIGYSGVELNKMVLSTSIKGQRVLFVEGTAPLVAYGGSYLPAVILEEKSGLRVGELALPSGDSLLLSETSLAKMGVQEGLVEIIYPNRETYIGIYTGGSFQAPLFSYSSGAFVGIQAVETRIVWTSMGQREFYAQVASVSELLGSMFGRGFKEELVETVLLNGLTDAQALDVVNTLARNVEWLKTLSSRGRTELVRRITDYVAKGETAEEAIERARKESEEFVKSLELETLEFYNSISDAQLANEVLSLIRHIQERLGAEAARWLLTVLQRVYAEALKSTMGDREFASNRLRSVVEEAFKYPESIAQGCALSSAIVKELMQTGTDLLTPKHFSEGVSVWSGGYIRIEKKIEPGLYWIIAKENGKILATWTWRTVEGSSLVHVPSDKVDILKGKVFDLEIYPYKWELYFPKEFDAYDYHFEIDPWRNTLRIDKDGEKYTIPFNNPRIKESTPRGVALVVETSLRSTRYGTLLILEFFEKGMGFSVVEKSGYAHPIESFEIRDGLVEILHENEVFKAPLNPKELRYGKIELERPIDLSDLEYGTSLVVLLRERFRYGDVEELRENLKTEREILRLYWDNGKVTYCANEILGIKIPGGTKKIVAIERARIMEVEKFVFDVVRAEESTRDHYTGRAGEAIVRFTPELAKYVINEVRRELGIGEEVPLKLLSVRFDKDEYYEAREKVISEDVRPDFLVVKEDTDEVEAFVELKTTIELNPEAFERAMNDAIGEVEGVKKYYNVGLTIPGFAMALQFSPDAYLATHEIVKKKVQFVPRG